MAHAGRLIDSVSMSSCLYGSHGGRLHFRMNESITSFRTIGNDLPLQGNRVADMFESLQKRNMVPVGKRRRKPKRFVFFFPFYFFSFCARIWWNTFYSCVDTIMHQQKILTYIVWFVFLCSVSLCLTFLCSHLFLAHCRHPVKRFERPADRQAWERIMKEKYSEFAPLK